MTGLNIIRSLTSLRFFAALMVFCSHLRLSIEYHSPIPFFEFIWNGVFYEGYIGVTFFFILSGFILTYSYNSLFQSEKISRQKFLFLRFARIYPTHLLLLILAICMNPFSVHSFAPLITNALLLQSTVPSEQFYFSFNAVSWSISSEYIFYLLFPFFIVIPQKKLFKIMLSWLITTIFLILISLNYNFLINAHWFFYIFPGTRLLDFLTGILLAKAFMADKSIIRTQPNWIFHLAEPLSIFLLIFFVYIALKQNIPQVYRFDLFYILPMSLVILTFAYEKGFLSKLLTSRIFVFLGEISFAIYMFHQLIFSIIPRHFPLSMFSDAVLPPKTMLAIVMLSVTLGIASLSFLCFEKPINRMLRHQMNKRNMATTLVKDV